MSSTKFLAILPQTFKAGDKIRIRGKVTTNAQQFSINFANEICKNPENITYHFKWIIPEDIIVENYKQNGIWVDHKESQYNVFDGPAFALEFAFQEEGIYVYLIYGDGRNMITYYEPEFDLSDIVSIQVWGDVEKINELAFVYQ